MFFSKEVIFFPSFYFLAMYIPLIKLSTPAISKNVYLFFLELNGWPERRRYAGRQDEYRGPTKTACRAAWSPQNIRRHAGTRGIQTSVHNNWGVKYLMPNNLSPEIMVKCKYPKFDFFMTNSACPRSSDPLYIVTYYKKWGTYSWTDGLCTWVLGICLK